MSTAKMSPDRATNRFTFPRLLILLAACFLFCRPVPAESALQSEAGPGVYGVKSTGHEQTVQTLHEAHVADVSSPPHRETITRLKQEGFRVFLTLNAFGGTAGWKEFPDAVPVAASGEPVSSTIGGVCLSHFP